MKLEERHERKDGLGQLAQQRGIRESVLRSAGIHRSDSDRRRGWWVLPYKHRSGEWKLRYRNPITTGRPKYLDDPGAQPHLYNPGLLGPGEDEVWFCEGEFDTLCLIEHGYKAIGVHGVEFVPGEGESETRRGWHMSWKLLFEGTRCIVMFDNDEAGIRGGRRLANVLGGEVFDEWDPRFTDVNDWHVGDRSGLAVVLRDFSGRVSGRGRMD